MEHYWDGNHSRQQEYQDLYDKHVPMEGKCKTVHGELIRSISRLYYDYCNNGNCNAYDDQSKEVSDFYGYFLEYLRRYLDNHDYIDSIEDIILCARDSRNPDLYYSDEKMSVYDKVTDQVLDYIKSHPDEKRID